MGFIKNIILKYAIKALVSKLEELETKSEELKELRKNVYSLGIPDLLEHYLEMLAQKQLDTLSLIDYVKLLIEPLDDDKEQIIVKVLEGLNPNK